jgi:uncharacterized protein (DUF983 family)
MENLAGKCPKCGRTHQLRRAHLRRHDRVRRKGVDYEVLAVQPFDWRGETAYFRASCRRLAG